MARLEQRPVITVDVSLRLSEVEARALEALAGYGDRAFLETFYKYMGEHYLKPHEAGLRSLFESVRQTLPPILSRVDAARKTFQVGPGEPSRQESGEKEGGQG